MQSTKKESKPIVIGATYKYQGNLLCAASIKSESDDGAAKKYLPLSGRFVTVIWISPDGYCTIAYNASGLNKSAATGQVFHQVSKDNLIQSDF